MKVKVYIDGQEGTTGLQLQKRLLHHDAIELISIDESMRKDNEERTRLMNNADVVFLCLPDEAAKEAATFVTNENTIVIDASTAHRVSPDWDYGLPELSAQHRQKIRQSKRIANPGCYATGFLVAVYPLIALQIADKGFPFSCHGISGYSGGGKKMVAEYERQDRPYQLSSPRQYALSAGHKHLLEMQQIAGLDTPPLFNPIVCDFYSGMAVSVPMHVRMLHKKVQREELQQMLTDYYWDQPLISVRGMEGDGFLAANEIKNTCSLKLHVTGNDERITLVSVFDNLGKGASGAAIQNMNIALGLEESASLLGGQWL